MANKKQDATSGRKDKGKSKSESATAQRDTGEYIGDLNYTSPYSGVLIPHCIAHSKAQDEPDKLLEELDADEAERQSLIRKLTKRGSTLNLQHLDIDDLQKIYANMKMEAHPTSLLQGHPGVGFLLSPRYAHMLTNP
jgi:hypothetical protein